MSLPWCKYHIGQPIIKFCNYDISDTTLNLRGFQLYHEGISVGLFLLLLLLFSSMKEYK